MRYGTQMSVKLILLKSGENIVSIIKEGYFEDKLVCYILDNPCLITINGTYKILDDEDGGNRVSISLQSWPSLSKQVSIEIPPDWVVTIVEPNEELEQMYKSQVLCIKKNETNQIIIADEQSDSSNSD